MRLDIAGAASGASVIIGEDSCASVHIADAASCGTASPIIDEDPKALILQTRLLEIVPR